MAHSNQPQSSLSILRKPKVCERIACSPSSLHNKISPKSKYFDSTFPKPIRLGANSVGWIEGEIDAWLQSRERVNGTSEPAITQEDKASIQMSESSPKHRPIMVEVRKQRPLQVSCHR